ncbi:rubredoxin [Thermoflexibacter ruber]|uniref:Rubredoxin n=1 Tax=Thermoflexibacter ruber TaxID=1003 RepID=A0A1I2BIH0_9BACT|nr:rubredoxin [Thermoflexibacter ruber]SFE55936.1 Rubredoxin [Thermoflexibacter ruber]
MKKFTTIKINFTGGIIALSKLQDILTSSQKVGIRNIRFGLRQQLILDIPQKLQNIFEKELKSKEILYETDLDSFPNIVSSYPAEEVFIEDNWNSEGVYRDIFDLFDYRPKLKINISDHSQNFTPFFTGNINWIASEDTHLWFLVVRFPKTNVVFEWKELIYSLDIPKVSRTIEEIIISSGVDFYGNDRANGELLFFKVKQKIAYISKPIEKKMELPPFNLPYYEGFNRQGNKTWLGIYRRDELFSVEFLLEICTLCLQTKIGHICITPWKSLIVKGIEEKDRKLWSRIMDKYEMNIRHAANELNWQIEDHSNEGNQLKQYLIKYLNKYDMRTFGLCFGIQLRPKSELFGSVIIRKKYIKLLGIKLLPLYDILHTENFNPNQRQLYTFKKNVSRLQLGKQLCEICHFFYAWKSVQEERQKPNQITYKDDSNAYEPNSPFNVVYQCADCLSVYDETVGEPDRGIEQGTPFDLLPADYCCPLCEAKKEQYVRVNMVENKIVRTSM